MTNEFNLDGKDIRFIDSHYKDLFRVPDGGCIQIHYPDETVVKPCKFIDEYHTQIGTNVFHICQFAEIMERNGARMLGVHRQTIYYIVANEDFELIKVGRYKRVTKESFEKWYHNQTRYQLAEDRQERS